MSEKIDRRSFLATTGVGLSMLGALGGTASAEAPDTAQAAANAAHSDNLLQSNLARRMMNTPAPNELFRADPLKKVRVGFIGVGGQGSSHVRNFTGIPNVEIKAVCDLVESKVVRNQEVVTHAGMSKPEGYFKGDHDFLNLVARDDIDLVYIVTPWEWHVPMMLAALKAGKHAVTEVPAAITLEECWQLVEAQEQSKRHACMMENCCYGRFELMVLNLVRQGLLGELIHAEGGYLHDLRQVKFGTVGEGEWRRAHATRRNGNLYPTHGLGPLAQCLNINRGDQFDFMVSMSSKTRGLELYAKSHLEAGDARRNERYVLGDVNSSLIRSRNGCTLVVMHSCDCPRPYSRITNLQGTKGIVNGYPDRVYIQGRSPNDTFQKAEELYPEFDHPLWKSRGANATSAGHGGMDYIEDFRLVECLLKGEPTDQNVYDAASWSAVSALSEWSVAHNSRPIDFPDFTRGQWKKWQPLGIIET
jgi:predicted dehydrogenase